MEHWVGRDTAQQALSTFDVWVKTLKLLVGLEEPGGLDFKKVDACQTLNKNNLVRTHVNVAIETVGRWMVQSCCELALQVLAESSSSRSGRFLLVIQE